MPYDRWRAVEYANRWWNGYNPQFVKFPSNDCTNYISQCLWAGGAPMQGFGNRSRGWWYKFGRAPSWSYSWVVAHSLKNYLQNAKTGLRGIRVSSPFELEPGDVICYDFDGDGRWQHNAIVVAKDWSGMPLVNTHTLNRIRHPWHLGDSPAVTPKVQYAFFRIVV